MVRSRRADWLDRTILESKPGQTPEADFDAWRNAHPRAIRRLKQRATTIPRSEPFLASTSRLARNAVRSPAVRLAAAATIVAGVLLLTTWRSDRESPSATPPTTAASQTAHPAPQVVDPAQEELRLADDLFAHKDVDGLLSLLHSTQSQTVFLAVAYLGEIGDASSLPTLESFAAQWQGPAQENPFQKAIDQILAANGQGNAELMQDTQTPVAIVQSPQQSQLSEVLICRGAVVNEANVPVAGAQVWAQSCAKDLKLTDLTTPVQTDQQGRFSLTVPAGDTDVTDRVYLLSRHSDYALGWSRLPSDGETTSIDDCRIVLYESAFVAGVVTDVRGKPISGALVAPRIVPAHEPTSSQEYCCGTESGRVVKTDQAGRFVIDDVPDGSLLSLSVSRRDYGTYDSREGYGSFLGTSPYLDPDSHTIRAGRKDIRIELLSAEGSIDGRILDEHGAPYRSDVALRCEDRNRIRMRLGYSYADGRCTLMEVAPRGNCSIDANNKGRFRIEDLQVGEYVVAAIDPASGLLITPWTNVTISESQHRVQMTLRVDTPIDVTIRVRKQTGEPLGDALVTPEFGSTPPTYTDSNGLCVLHLHPGSHAIRALAWPYDNNSNMVVQTSRDSTDRHRDVFVDSLPQRRGRLIDESGWPVRGSVREYLGERVLTDVDGRFAILTRSVNVPCYAGNVEGTRARVFVWPASSERTELQIRLEPLAVFTGRVLGPEGAPMNDARVIFDLIALDASDTSDGRYSGTLRCSMFLFEGRFRLEIPVGLEQVLSVSSEGLKGQADPIDPAPGQTYDLGDIVLQPR